MFFADKRSTISDLYQEHSSMFESYILKCSTDSNITAHRRWFQDTTASMMLYLLQQYTDKKFTFTYNSARYSSVHNYTPPQANKTHHVITIYFTTDPSTYDDLDMLANKIQLHDIKNISMALMLDKKHKIRLFNGYTETMVFTNQYARTILRKIIALLPKLHDIKIPAKYENIFTSYGEEDYEAWLKAYTTWLTEENITLTYFTKNLEEALTKNEQNLIRNLMANIESHKRVINDLERGLSNNYQNYNSDLLRLHALKTLPKTEINLAPYIIDHPYINSFKAHDSIVELIFISPISYWDNDILEAYFRNEGSIIHDRDFSKRFFKEVFIDKKYTMFTQTTVVINFAANLIESHVPSFNDFKYMPQPHISGFNCWGSNHSYALKSLAEKQYEQMIEQISAATQNLNIADSTVIEWMVNKLNGSEFDHTFCLQNNETKELLTIGAYKEGYVVNEAN